MRQYEEFIEEHHTDDVAMFTVDPLEPKFNEIVHPRAYLEFPERFWQSHEKLLWFILIIGLLVNIVPFLTFFMAYRW